MSFKDLLKASVARRKKEFTIKIKDGEDVAFVATELSYLDRVELGTLFDKEGDLNLRLVAMSIIDQDGQRMTLEQARNLSNEHQEVFYRAALDVNSSESDKSDKKKEKANA